ncbi:NUDIX domain-containing protein [Actinopolymorpha alba]|uniref:NUDIX domain-containing protein n=1 Tax=Actinopolymorpha alba TaxID=533267 RepID=UPI000374CD10|nr:NUDIX domain-containing protein [Actinopolymorpha alba]
MKDGSSGRRRHPELLRILGQHRPAAVHREAWGPGGSIPLEFSSYLTTVRVPDELVSSVRCIVATPGGVVVCENRHERHVWPGGRPEPGETMTEAVVREVAEETGWQVDRATLTYLGFVHLAHLGPRPDGYAYPYPDSVQLVFGGTATGRLVDANANWTDTDGWELASRVAPPAELGMVPLSPLQGPFLQAYLGAAPAVVRDRDGGEHGSPGQ